MTTAVRRADQVGTVLEDPAVDPDGNVWPGHVLVAWDTGSVEVVEVGDLDPIDDVSRR
ncbi:hypothetical protein [Rhodococcus koreensis]|uniref:hypothetical protein n=1 Tax=Rhodococcus koreensis TaxID=99653 RepID=UPI0036DED3BC